MLFEKRKEKRKGRAGLKKKRRDALEKKARERREEEERRKIKEREESFCHGETLFSEKKSKEEERKESLPDSMRDRGKRNKKEREIHSMMKV